MRTSLQPMGVWLLLPFLVSACVGAPPDRSPTATPASVDAQPSFVGKIWISADPSAALGTMRIFLPGGELVMDSCVETYRLAHWESIADKRIAWDEDTARIEAEIVATAADELHLRLRLRDDIRDEHYRLARVPYVCPDSRPAA